MKIANCAAIVTGGGSGMGAETARALAAAGAKVALLDLKEDAAKQVAQETKGLAIRCDVSDAAHVAAALHAAKEAHGIARICINCAGIGPAKRMVGKLGPMRLEEFAKVITVNLLGTFNVMRLVATEMCNLDPLNGSDERGVIINTASIAAFEGQIGQTAYSASKGGIVSMTLPAARELAQFGIRVNTIAPGIVATPMLLSMPQNVQDSLAASVPFPKRMGRPEEFAKLVLHIIENELINGTTIRLDGAMRMPPK
jgi:NAD(P)-dependent dehydrogenase (short-subunit alcohol dehydrogenase family)